MNRWMRGALMCLILTVPLRGQQYDTLDASLVFTTGRLDSTYIINPSTGIKMWRLDTAYYADPRYRMPEPGQYLEILAKSFTTTDTVSSPIDTVILRQMTITRRRLGSSHYLDTGWVVIPIINIQTGSRDTMAIIGLQGYTYQGKTFYYVRFTPASDFSDWVPWRIERYGRIRSPHVLEFEFWRRKRPQ